MKSQRSRLPSRKRKGKGARGRRRGDRPIVSILIVRGLLLFCAFAVGFTFFIVAVRDVAKRPSDHPILQAEKNVPAVSVEEGASSHPSVSVESSLAEAGLINRGPITFSGQPNSSIDSSSQPTTQRSKNQRNTFFKNGEARSENEHLAESVQTSLLPYEEKQNAHSVSSAQDSRDVVASHSMTKNDVPNNQDGDAVQLALNAPPPSTLNYGATVKPETCRLALVIDDVGPDHAAALRTIRLPAVVTLAFLPYAQDVTRLSHQAFLSGHDVLIHMPMEPDNLAHNNPGPQALMVTLSSADIYARVQQSIAAIPDAIGLNNHMGSRFTQSAEALSPVIQALAEHKLFFLDSRTTPNSAGKMLAVQYGVGFVDRQVFLDNDIKANLILKQLKEARRLACKRGWAVAIGHPHTVTLNVLEQWISAAVQQGVKLVSLHTLVTYPQ